MLPPPAWRKLHIVRQPLLHMHIGLDLAVVVVQRSAHLTGFCGDWKIQWIVRKVPCRKQKGNLSMYQAVVYIELLA